MRIDCSIPVDHRTGVSVYYDDYKRRLAVDYSQIKPTSAFRRNKPHPTKDFLEPRREPQEGVGLQNKVRHAVRNYLNEIYQRSNSQNAAYSDLPPKYFRPEAGDRHLESRGYLSTTQPLLNYRPTSAYNPPVVAGGSFGVTGQQITKPSSSVAVERIPPPELQGESKRERSVRIKETIKEANRLRTPQPKAEVWQKNRTTPVPPQNRPHWVGTETEKPRPKPKRITSAPPGVQGYTYYPQAPPRPPTMDSDDDMTTKLEAWSKGASNYEKEVIFNMLKEITPRPEETPNTPMTEGFRKIADGPAADYHRYGAPRIVSGPPQGGNMSYEKKIRKIHSAPIKKMGGLVSTATQRPLHDQRIYRLKGQDTRLNPSPGEERKLNQYMKQLENSAYAPSKKSSRFAGVPMHSHPSRKVAGSQDYQCKVSFFQSVRSPFRKHFTIHPDFTSENLKRRKPVSHTITHFRY